jgi:hypothetical protein
MIRAAVRWFSFLVFSLLLLGLAAPVPAQTNAGAMEAMKHLLEAAGKSANDWLKVVDAGEYPRSWDEAAAVAKKTATREVWSQNLEKIRRPLGKMVSRRVYSVDYSTNLPGVPPGQYVVIIFATAFENKPQAFERIIPTLDPDGVWRVSGYFIQ